MGLLISPLLFLAISISCYANESINKIGVVDIQQDENGYIWFAGQQGLTRYDSVNIVHFSSSSPHWKLPFNWILSFVIDNDVVYLGTENNGIWQLNTANGNTTQVAIPIAHKRIAKLIKYLNKLYYISSNGFHVFDMEKGSTITIADGNKPTALIRKDNTFYFSDSNGLYQYHIMTDNLKKLSTKAMKDITTVNHGVISIESNNLHLFDNNRHQVKTFNSELQSITLDNTNNAVFIAAKNGDLYKVHGESLAFQRHNFTMPQNLVAYDIFHDSNGILWTATSLGIKKISETTTILHQATFKTSLNILKVLQYNNSLIVGSYGEGLAQFDNGNLTMLDTINQQLTGQGKVIADLKMVNNLIYLATYDGLWSVDLTTQTVLKVPLPLQNQLLLSLEYSQNKLFITTENDGVVVLNPTTHTLIKHIKGKQLSSAETIDVALADNNDLWIATANGLDIYQLELDTLKNVPMPSQHKAISLSLYENKIYCATKGDGIFVYNNQGELIDRVAIGLDISDIHVIGKAIWISARPGLYRLQPTNNSIELIDGTQNYSFTDEVLFADGKLYAASFSGIIEQKNTEKNKFNAKIVISETVISGAHFLNKHAINIQSASDIVDLRVASLDFRNGPIKQFKYRINNNSWIPFVADQLTLTGLAAGNYAIEIKGTNSLGQWSDFVAFANINVASPWYWSPTLKIIYSSSFFILALFFLWLTFLKAHFINQIYQRLVEDRKLKGEPVIALNKRLALLKQNLLSETPNIDKAVELTDHCIELLVDKNKHSMPDRLFNNSLSQSLLFLKDYLQQEFLTELVYKMELAEYRLPLDMQKDLYSIIYAAINTAVNNSEQCNFSLQLQEVRNKLWLTLKDNNNNFSDYSNNTNFTMTMYYIRKVAGQYNASINTFDEQHKGSQLVISFPFNQHQIPKQPVTDKNVY